MKKIKPRKNTQPKKLFHDRTDEKNYFIHYRMSKIYVRHGMILDKIH